MFTGIVQTTGKVISKTQTGDSVEFDISPSEDIYSEDIKTGESISINGVCLTVTAIEKGSFKFTAVKETLSKTNLGELNTGDFLNLEKAMSINSRLDGHLVQGHVDTTGKINKIIENTGSHEFFIFFDSKFRDYIIKIGSISIDGISLTIADITEETDDGIEIKIAIIPHTYQNTTFRHLKEGDKVNIEFDMMGKYIKRIFENNIK
ncbi:MAG: riboflavin synthase [Ignavibacteria bacterium]|nr:riboflavin synthase [Ignavibacteria bacterium]